MAAKSGSIKCGNWFLYPSEEITPTIPSTATRVITVSADDAYSMQLADFSGRGCDTLEKQIN